MKRTIVIILAVLSMLAFLYIRHYFSRAFHFNDIFGILDLVISIFLLLIVAIPLSPLLALVPFKQTSFLYRLSFTYPISIILVSTLISWAFYVVGPSYDDIKQEADLDCSSIKTGHFNFMDEKIERDLYHQTETSRQTGHSETVDIEWIGDCEYQLRSGDIIKAKVKIVKVDEDGYDCYADYNGRTTRRLRILRDKNTFK